MTSELEALIMADADTCPAPLRTQAIRELQDEVKRLRAMAEELLNTSTRWRVSARGLRSEVERGVAVRQSIESKMARVQVLESNADSIEQALAVPTGHLGEAQQQRIRGDKLAADLAHVVVERDTLLVDAARLRAAFEDIVQLRAALEDIASASRAPLHASGDIVARIAERALEATKTER